MAETERVVVITGGSRGIGRAVAEAFARDASQLILVHNDPDDRAAEETLALVAREGAKAEAHRIDVSSRTHVEGLFGDVIERWGGVDVLVNNAGITRDTLLMRMSEEDWDTVLSVNLKSVFNCTRSVIQSMIKRRTGSVVNISSVVGQIGNAGQANYAASKAGILGFTRSVAREAAPRGVRVNAVAPGFIDTEMTANLPQKAKDAFMSQIPMGRIGTPKDVAEVVYWLCSDVASYVTGQTIHVNGGLYM